MAFDITTTAGVVKTHLEGSGLFFAVDIIKPRSPVAEGPYACIYPERMRVVETTMVRTIEQHVLRVEVYQARHTQDDDDDAISPSTLTAQVANLFVGDFSLGGNVRNVDFGGQYGQALEAEFVDAEVARTPYHVSNITVPLIVDGDADFVA